MYGLRAVLVALPLLAAACTAPKSKVCRDTCAREASCIESASQTESSFDEGECVAACAALERDPEARILVTRHAECVAAAGKSCEQILECD